MCWVRVTGGGQSSNDKPEESKRLFPKVLSVPGTEEAGRKGIYKRRIVWWGEIHGAEKKGGAMGTCDPGRTRHLGGNTLGCCGFLCVFFVPNQQQH